MTDASLADATRAAYEGLVEASKALDEFQRIFDAATELVSAMDDLAHTQEPPLIDPKRFIPNPDGFRHYSLKVVS